MRNENDIEIYHQFLKSRMKLGHCIRYEEEMLTATMETREM